MEKFYFWINLYKVISIKNKTNAEEFRLLLSDVWHLT